MSSKSISSESFLEKFEFYFIGLTFTLLVASIQTSKFSGYPSFSTYTELTGWAILTISGLIGLSKLEGIPAIIYVKKRKSSLEEINQQLRLSQSRGVTTAVDADSGRTVSIFDTITRLESTITEYDNKLKDIGRKHEWKHQIQKYSFTIGLVAIAVARGVKALQPIIIAC